jgi:hypothetical protein
MNDYPKGCDDQGKEWGFEGVCSDRRNTAPYSPEFVLAGPEPEEFDCIQQLTCFSSEP